MDAVFSIPEHERLSIMDRTIAARIRKAKDGLPWCAQPPTGRQFKKTGKNSGEWSVTNEGHRLGQLLARYADGESIKSLINEFGFPSADRVRHAMNYSQLSGVYVARFNCPELGIVDLKLPVPAVPEIISSELAKRVKQRASHNRTYNKQERGTYLLTGFVRCARCNTSLTGQTNGRKRYRHYSRGSECGYPSINGELLESQVLDFLYRFFLDETAFNDAVKREMPSADDRHNLVRDADRAKKQLLGVNRSITNLVNAIADGADVGLLLDKQDSLKAERTA